jgi:alcohol dehydrogenase class IV
VFCTYNLQRCTVDVICIVILQTPSMAICDANLVDSMPRSLTCYGGLDALVHGLESYVSVCATDFTKGAFAYNITCVCNKWCV